MPPSPTDALRRAIAARVAAVFADPAVPPVVRRPDGWFGPDAVAWRIHGDLGAMMVGGIAGLLLQMLRPDVLAAVWDHSVFRGDMGGRLRRTARFLAVTTYGGADEAAAAVARVNAIHARLAGTLPDGTPYRAADPRALAWVHATEAVSFLGAWTALREPAMAVMDADRYLAEMAVVGRALGADPVPTTLADAWSLIRAERPRLRADARTRAVAARILDGNADGPADRAMGALVRRAAVDRLPGWARTLHGLPGSGAGRPAVRAGAAGLSRLLGWALAG